MMKRSILGLFLALAGVVGGAILMRGRQQPQTLVSAPSQSSTVSLEKPAMVSDLEKISIDDIPPEVLQAMNHQQRPNSAAGARPDPSVMVQADLTPSAFLALLDTAQSRAEIEALLFSVPLSPVLADELMARLDSGQYAGQADAVLALLVRTGHDSAVRYVIQKALALSDSGNPDDAAELLGALNHAAEVAGAQLLARVSFDSIAGVPPLEELPDCVYSGVMSAVLGFSDSQLMGVTLYTNMLDLPSEEAEARWKLVPHPELLSRLAHDRFKSGDMPAGNEITQSLAELPDPNVPLAFFKLAHSPINLDDLSAVAYEWALANPSARDVSAIDERLVDGNAPMEERVVAAMMFATRGADALSTLRKLLAHESDADALAVLEAAVELALNGPAD
jgi:hypothetical protein